MKLRAALNNARPRCAGCDAPIPFARSGWFCSDACDGEDMARRVGLVRVAYAITDAARAARKVENHGNS